MLAWTLNFCASVLISNSGIAMLVNVSLIFTIMDALWSLSKRDVFLFPISSDTCKLMNEQIDQFILYAVLDNL